MAWIIWQHNMIDERSQIIDSIHTFVDTAQERLKQVKDENINDDRLSSPFIAEIELNTVINLDLDITVERDSKGRQKEFRDENLL